MRPRQIARNFGEKREKKETTRELKRGKECCNGKMKPLVNQETVYIDPANDTDDQDNKTQMIPPMLQESTRCVKKQMIRRMIQQSLA